MNKIVFFGDSITAGFTQLDLHSNVINMGVSGDKIYSLIGRIEEIIAQKPDKLFVLIGINDLLNEKEYWGKYIKVDFDLLYFALIKLIKDNFLDAEIYLQSILPISIKHKDVKEMNKEIRQMNRVIKDHTKAFNWTYIDLYNEFKLKDKSMNPDYTTDGVHLNTKGYDLFYKLIKEYL